MKIQRDYGGAYDIDPNMYFTKDDLLDLAYAVIDVLNQAATEDSYYDIEDIWMDEDDNIYMSVITPDEDSAEGEVRVDMRRIRKPSDILKYTDALVGDILDNRYLGYDADEAFMQAIE